MSILISSKQQRDETALYVPSSEIKSIHELSLSADESSRADAASIKALEYLATGEAEVLEEELLKIIALADLDNSKTVIALARALDANLELFANFVKNLLDSKYSTLQPSVVVETAEVLKDDAKIVSSVAWGKFNTMLKNPAMASLLFENSISLQRNISKDTAERLANINSAGAGYLHRAPQEAKDQMTTAVFNRQPISELLDQYGKTDKKIPLNIVKKLQEDLQYQAVVNNYGNMNSVENFFTFIFSFVPAVKRYRNRKTVLLSKIQEAESFISTEDALVQQQQLENSVPTEMEVNLADTFLGQAFQEAEEDVSVQQQQLENSVPTEMEINLADTFLGQAFQEVEKFVSTEIASVQQQQSEITTSAEMKSLITLKDGINVSSVHSQSGSNIFTPPRQQNKSFLTSLYQQSESNFSPPQQQGGSVFSPPHQQSGSVFSPPHQQNGSIFSPPHQQSGSVFSPLPHQQNGGVFSPPQQQGGSVFTPPRQQSESAFTPPHQHCGSVNSLQENNGLTEVSCQKKLVF